MTTYKAVYVQNANAHWQELHTHAKGYMIHEYNSRYSTHLTCSSLHLTRLKTLQYDCLNLLRALEPFQCGHSVAQVCHALEQGC